MRQLGSGRLGSRTAVEDFKPNAASAGVAAVCRLHDRASSSALHGDILATRRRTRRKRAIRKSVPVASAPLPTQRNAASSASSASKRSAGREREQPQ